MFDFHFGTAREIGAREEDYLVFVKRMLPRWCNSIPDSEYIALHRLLKAEKHRRPVYVETGVGASSLVLLYHAMKRGGTLWSWDINGLKGAFLRSVVTDTLSTALDKPVAKHWKFVAYSSHSPQLGIDILAEQKIAVDFCFLDSEHTRENLLGELARLAPVLKPGAVVTIDDANYDYVHTNVAYINMLRKKLGLKAVPAPAGNQGKMFYEEVEIFLKERFHGVKRLAHSYRKEYKRDLFWAYYDADRRVMGKQGMEKLGNLGRRFEAWRVGGRD